MYDDSSIELLSSETVEVRQLPQSPDLPTLPPTVSSPSVAAPSDEDVAALSEVAARDEDEDAEPSPPPKRVTRSKVPSAGSQRHK